MLLDIMIGGPLLLYESVTDSISDCGLLSEMGKKQALKILNLVKGKSYFVGDARVWAAVIVYIYFRITFTKVPARKVAEFFGVSRDYIYKRAKQVIKSLRLRPFDERFVHPTTIVDKFRYAYYFLPKDVFYSWFKELKGGFFEDELRVEIRKLRNDFQEAFKSFFGTMDVYFRDGWEMEKYLNDFLKWKFFNWRIPVINKTEAQISKRFNLYKEPILLQIRDALRDAKDIGLICGKTKISVIKRYKELYELLHSGIRPNLDMTTFIMNVVEDESWIPSIVLKELLFEYKERMLLLFQKAFPTIRTMSELINFLKNVRSDWDNDVSSMPTLPEEDLEAL